MARLSSLAETLADYARSEAKRVSADSISPIHLLAAVRRWQEEKFDTQFPGMAESIRAALRTTAGQSTKAPDLSEDIIGILKEVSGPEDAWTMAESLTEITKDLRNSSLTGFTHPSRGDASTSSVDSPPAPEESTPDPLPFAITDGLIERLSSISGRDSDDLLSSVLSAAHAVAVETLGHTPTDLSEKICNAAMVDPRDLGAESSMGTLVADVAQCGHPEAGKAATQLALALVEVAEWAAAMDTNVTVEEIERIDTIRLRLRDQLADKIDAESEAMSAFEEKFAHLVGMQSVKAEIRKRVDFLVVNKRREKRGMPPAGHRMHMAFVGNPGTGKTTVARLYGELLNDLGLLPTRNFIETDRSGLVAGFVGQTEEKTLEAINRADGGVLFIDEAYALDDGYQSNKGFGEEATNVIVKQMEDRRDRLVVIFAGYREPTLNFFTLNPGLKSRVPVVVDFPDYSTSELVEIAERIAGSRRLVIDGGAKDRMAILLARSAETDAFGNARTVENILESAERNVVDRNSSLGNLATEAELRTITADDLPDVPPAHRKVIGFGPSGYA